MGEGSGESARLFGRPGAERLWRTLDEAVEEQSTQHLETWQRSFDPRPPVGLPPEALIVVEAHTAHPPQHHLPSADRILDWMAEYASEQEVDEWMAESVADACAGPAVEAVAEALRMVVARDVRYRMANEHVATHHLTRTWQWSDGHSGDRRHVDVWAPDSGQFGSNGRPT